MKRITLLLVLSASLLSCVGCAGPYCRSRGCGLSGFFAGGNRGCGARPCGGGCEEGGCGMGGCGMGGCAMGGCESGRCGMGGCGMGNRPVAHQFAAAMNGMRPGNIVHGGCSSMGGGKYGYSNDCLGYPPPASDAQWPTVGYPYYTLRGPRDFLVNNPPSIGR